MAGIYLHIPFCKTKCHYCDFYKSTNLAAKHDFLLALKQEISMRKGELGDEAIHSIYFGGGTPSVLKVSEINELIQFVYDSFFIVSDAEITLEANPDDLTPVFLKDLRNTPVNRLSIGTQSFADNDLKCMNRRHSSQQAVDSVKAAQKAGFKNISIDLIYGLPNQTLQQWQQNIEIAISLDVQHISAYHLTYHEGTVFYDYLKTGKIKELPDQLSFDQFALLKSKLEEAGFEHYEISNFARNGLYSRHNRAYWERKSYLGFGPSAHSFNQKTRRWNISSLNTYLHNLKNDLPYWEYENLSLQDQYNDFMITSLRTMWGISDRYLVQNFGQKFALHLKNEIQTFLDSGHVVFENGSYRLNTEGLFISDKIMEQLIWVEEF